MESTLRSGGEVFLLARVTWEGSSEEVASSGPRGTPCDADTAFVRFFLSPAAAVLQPRCLNSLGSEHWECRHSI